MSIAKELNLWYYLYSDLGGDFIKSKEINSKPFLKWAGGKTQLIPKIKDYLIFDHKYKKYAEPFVGSGAVLFYVLNNFDLDYVYINDINEDLIFVYKSIRDKAGELIEFLDTIEKDYLSRDEEERKSYFYKMRDKFNKFKKQNIFEVERAGIMIFLNKTCFNGLYRENSKGEFNVPVGSYKNPTICDKENIISVSNKLNGVEINCGDYKNSIDFIDDETIVYFDPPYRPLSNSSSFTSYTKSGFNDENQIELSKYYKKLDKLGARLILSNSDPKNCDKEDDFFDELYSGYFIERVEAKRIINSKASKRGNVNELLITNFRRNYEKI